MGSNRLSGQSAMEFIMVFTILVAALVVAAWISLERTNEISAARTRLEVGNMLSDVSNKINTAFLEGPGFSVRLDLPEKLLGADYSIQAHSNNLYLDFRGATYIRQMITQNITGGFATGKNTIRNVGGIIVIENG